MRDTKADDPYSEYRVGEVVPKNGVYKCGVSGQRMTLEKGERFPVCEPETDQETIWVLDEAA